MVSDNESRNRLHRPPASHLATGKRKRLGLGATLLKLCPYACTWLVCICFHCYTTTGASFAMLHHTGANRAVAQLEST
jgi:hypothetical protein